MAEGLLARHLRDRGIEATVSSVGLLTEGMPATDVAVEVLAERGIDIGEHRSRRITPEILGAADLILGMTREHVREAALRRPDAYGRIFTLKEVVRRGEAAGPRPGDEAIPVWVKALQADRDPALHLGASEDDDVADPIGLGVSVYEQTADDLDDLTTRLVDLLWQEREPHALAN
jgi:protein-tyrosine phosphatase